MSTGTEGLRGSLLANKNFCLYKQETPLSTASIWIEGTFLETCSTLDSSHHEVKPFLKHAQQIRYPSH